MLLPTNKKQLEIIIERKIPYISSKTVEILSKDDQEKVVQKFQKMIKNFMKKKILY